MKLTLFLEAITSICSLSIEETIEVAVGAGLSTIIEGVLYVGHLTSNGTLQFSLRLFPNSTGWEFIDSFENSVTKLVDLGVLHLTDTGIEQSDIYRQEFVTRRSPASSNSRDVNYLI